MSPCRWPWPWPLSACLATSSPLGCIPSSADSTNAASARSTVRDGNATSREVGMGIENARDWITALDGAYRQTLANRIGGGAFRSLWASECATHPNCVWIVHGARVEHYRWKQTDPKKLAEELGKAMLP